MASWKDAIAAIAPVLGTALSGGNPIIGGLAGKMIRSVLGLKDDAPDKEVERVIQTDPNALMKLKQVEADLKVKLKELDIEEQALVYKDKDSARRREIRLNDPTNKILAFSFVIGWAVINYIILVNGVSSTLPEPVLYRILGTLDAMLFLIGSYYFGDSSNNVQKDQYNNTNKS